MSNVASQLDFHVTGAFCGRSDAALKGRLPSREIHAPDEVGVARILTQRVEWRPDLEQRQPRVAFLEAPFEPAERLVLVAQTDVHFRDPPGTQIPLLFA